MSQKTLASQTDTLFKKAKPLTVFLALALASVATLELPPGADASRPAEQSRAPLAWNNGVANTPPMGWNSYDAFNWNVTEAQVKANADYMAANLKQFGWQYIVVDWAWYYPGSGTGSPNQNNLQPPLRMDANGRLLPDTTRFPSATGANGFKPLADYVHSKGLKFGVHLMRGIPRQAVAQNVPILGTNCTANQINNSTTASWLNLMWGLNMSNSCSQAYLNSVFQLFAAWGLDYVKVDDIAAPTYWSAEIVGYHNAIVNSGRNMVLSLSPGPTSTANASHVMANAHMWRVVNDVWDNWPALDAEFDVLASWVPFRAPGAWPDPDMIPIGRLALQGPVGSPRYSNFTADEQRTLMTLWVINRAPLIWGGNLVDNRAAELALMTNAAVMAVDQNSTNNRRITGGTFQVWAADIAGSNDKYVALFNRSTATGTVSVALSNFGAASATATDLWSGANLGTFNTTFSRSIPAHGAGLYRLVLSGAATGPLHRYQFEANANDTGSSVANGTLANGPTFVTGRVGQALNLAGGAGGSASQHVSLPAGIVNGLTNFTIATWVKLDTTSAWRRTFDFGTGTTVNMFLTPQSGSGTVRFAITTGGGGGEQQINGTSALPIGVWTHVAVTKSGNTGTLYVNGAQVGQNTAMTLSPTSLGNTTNNWIGRSQYSADPFLDGQVDEFRIYNRALSAAEVLSLFQNP